MGRWGWDMRTHCGTVRLGGLMQLTIDEAISDKFFYSQATSAILAP